MATFQAARDGNFGQDFLFSGERQPVHLPPLCLPPLLDSHLDGALQVLGWPDRKEAVDVVFQTLTGQPKPLGFEGAVCELMSQTHAMPDASSAIIDAEALMDFVQRNPGQALSRPEILVMLIVCFDVEAKTFQPERAQLHLNSVDGSAVLTSADVDEVLGEQTMSPGPLTWDDVDVSLEDFLGKAGFEMLLDFTEVPKS
ncbi:hypothetical protein DM813_05175 [Pseudomonas alkylphenolica]|uniref:Uncharacterized protein n=1 Tax=Pseudomonas alkylphenolica TaxID=237609 RepID=A0A443ZWM4_9PSED|nr:hypothetical protein [Pseudomonas alkylphenolica]RWU25123.1 hypothetical protein DM813_05175 [Pseudomonas alkylphenolica]